MDADRRIIALLAEGDFVSGERIASASKLKLAIIATRVMAVGPGLVKPSDNFMV